MTKTEYRDYIASEYWQERRRQFLADRWCCERCGIPRWLAVFAFDQDLHVDHLNYQRVGAELDADLQPLCRRCHEIKHFGVTAIPEVRRPLCSRCGNPTWTMEIDECPRCEGDHLVDDLMKVWFVGSWQTTVARLAEQYGTDAIVDVLIRFDEGGWKWREELHDFIVNRKKELSK